tara:strand:+ start:126 stop:485 length:360 start_codon:yes stop_codon:yes gene_type:complete
MKIIKLDDDGDISHLEEQEREKVAKLKVIGDHLYTKDIGLKDGNYFLLTETSSDGEYVEHHLRFFPPEEIRKVVSENPPEQLDGSTIVFTKKVKGKKYLFRTRWDFTPITSSLFHENVM